MWVALFFARALNYAILLSLILSNILVTFCFLKSSSSKEEKAQITAGIQPINESCKIMQHNAFLISLFCKKQVQGKTIKNGFTILWN